MSTPPVIRSTHKPMVPNGDAASKKLKTAGVVVGSVAFVALLIWLGVKAVAGSGEPRLNESTLVLSKFVTSKGFEKLTFDKQRLYYKVLDDRDKDIDQAYKEGGLTEGEYRNALEAAWLGKHINRAEKYSQLPPGAPRAAYIDQLLEKKEKKSTKKNDKPGKNEPVELSADETAAELKVESWPAPMREQWNLFHNAYKKEKKAREEAATKPSNK